MLGLVLDDALFVFGWLAALVGDDALDWWRAGYETGASAGLGGGGETFAAFGH
jgi:hypothetical protein